MIKIGIVIVNWNGWQDTVECISSLQKISIPHDWHVEIVVVDNASTDESLGKIKKEIQKYKKDNSGIIMIESERNRGFSGGNNLGIELLLGKKCDYVVLLNNDTFVDKGFLTHLINGAIGQNYQIAGPKIYFAPGFEYHGQYSKEEKGKVIWYAGGMIDWNNVYSTHRGVDMVDVGQFNTSTQTGFISGCCMLVKREVFETIGQLDDNYFMYLEDVDFCIRARKAGFKLGFVPDSVVWHKNAQSSDKPGSITHIYYQTRNRMIFGMKYTKLRTKIALIRESIVLVSKGGIRATAIKDFYLHHYGKRA